MKRSGWINRGIAATVYVVILGGCEQVMDIFEDGPRPALEKYLNGYIKGNLDEAYVYISAKDREVRTLAEYKLKYSDSPLAAVVAKRVSYEIQDIEVEGSTAIATVKVTRPDLSGVVKDFFGAAFSAAFGGADSKELEQKLADKYANQTLPTTTSTETFSLIKESEGWRVFLDWETEIKVSTAMAEAAALRKDKKLHAALAKLDEVLQLQSEMVEAKAERAEVVKEIADFDRKQSYIDKVKLYELEAR